MTARGRMFDMDGLPDLLKPCRGGFEVQDRGEESLQFIQVTFSALATLSLQ